ncbi:MAG: hypothetical protein AAGG50_18775 [Bacteroidota bacterium]
MRTSDNEQSEAVDDFERRCAHAPDSVYTHRSKPWRYIPIHPFADEPDILQSLGINLGDCRWADAYWRADDAVYFLQVWTQRVDIVERKPGLYVQWSETPPIRCYLDAVIADATVTRTCFESIMDQFHSSLKASPSLFSPTLSTALVPLKTLN